MVSSDRSGKLLLVIPAVIEKVGHEIRIDGDFANNLGAYLESFDEVCVACPPLGFGYSFPSTCSSSEIKNNENLNIIVLPTPYREDKYFLARSRVKKLLRDELKKADYRLISPHAGLDWSTLAAEICIEEGLAYNMEADWNLPEVMNFEWRQMSWGMNKVRKLLWRLYYVPKYNRVLRASSLALLQGGDVYHDFSAIAPNAHSVLNVQVTGDGLGDPLATSATSLSADACCASVIILSF